MKYWHDLAVGTQIETASHTLSEDEVQEFALEFDPQPYHLDREAAEASIFGGLCASGWQVNALTMRLVSDALSKEQVALLGIRSVNSCRWKMPLFVDDTINATLSIEAHNNDPVNSNFGLWQCSIVLQQQSQQPVVKMNADLIVAKTAATQTA